MGDNSNKVKQKNIATDIHNFLGFEYDIKEDEYDIKEDILPSSKEDVEHIFDIKKRIFQSNLEVEDEVETKKKYETDRSLGANKQNSYKFLGSYCEFCDFRPKERCPSVLEVHMRIHTGDKPFSCAVCQFSTADKCYLEIHMRKHTGEKPFKCHLCELAFTRKDSLRQHLTTHTSEKTFSCTECNFKCVRKKGLYQHWSFHCKFEHFKCSICVYKCRRSSELKNHMLIHPKIISCPKCDYMGRCVEDLDEHNITHRTNDVPSTCSKCRKVFKNKYLLRYHILRNICKDGI